MRDALRARWRTLVRRVRRIERREAEAVHRWIEHTENLVRVSAVVAVPLLIALVTALSNAVPTLSYLLFPPLASGSYTLFSDPEGRYSSPRRFVLGLTAGAACGWAALVASRVLLADPAGQFQASAAGAALAVFCTGVVTWALDVEEPSAYACGLLVLLIDASPAAYVVSVAASSSLVAIAFVVWRREFYENRAEYLYRSTQGDDHVLVPVRGDAPDATARLGAHLAAAHEAGKVVLLGIADADGDADGLADDLEGRAERVRTEVGVACQVAVVSTDSPAVATLRTAREENCDLVVAPYEQRHGHLSSYVRALFRGTVDVVAARLPPDDRRWRRILVPVRAAGEAAHTKVDFACRLAGPAGRVTVATCIDDEHDRRRAEETLADVVEAFDASFETRVVNDAVESFIARDAPEFDLTVIGASTDRSAASRFVSPPTFERIDEVDAAVAVVHLA